jgi:hypothetical protein
MKSSVIAEVLKAPESDIRSRPEAVEDKGSRAEESVPYDDGELESLWTPLNQWR